MLCHPLWLSPFSISFRRSCSGSKLIVLCTRTNCESLINGDNFKRTLTRLVSLHKFLWHGFRRKPSVNYCVICSPFFSRFFSSHRCGVTKYLQKREIVVSAPIQMQLNVPFSIWAWNVFCKLIWSICLIPKDTGRGFFSISFKK